MPEPKPGIKITKKTVELQDWFIYESEEDLLKHISEFDKFVQNLEPDMYVTSDSRHYEYRVTYLDEKKACTINATVVYSRTGAEKS